MIRNKAQSILVCGLCTAILPLYNQSHGHAHYPITPTPHSLVVLSLGPDSAVYSYIALS